jgi:hypothetical protein
MATDVKSAWLCITTFIATFDPTVFFSRSLSGTMAGLMPSWHPWIVMGYPLTSAEEDAYASCISWPGVNVTVPGSVIQDQGAVVGAGAMVTKSTPAISIRKGVPAKVTGNRKTGSRNNQPQDHIQSGSAVEMEGIAGVYPCVPA